MSERQDPRKPRISFGAASSSDQQLIPLRLAVVADLAPEGSPQRSGRTPLRIDKDSFNEVLRAVCPRVTFHVESQRPATNAFDKIEFSIKDLRSFHPASLVQEVEPLRKTLEFKQTLLDFRDRRVTLEQVLEKVKSSPLKFVPMEALANVLKEGGRGTAEPMPESRQMPAPRPVAQSEEALDSILSMVETPPESRRGSTAGTEGAAHVGQFISEMFLQTTTRTPVNQRGLEGLIAEIDQAMSAKMAAILGHPEFRRLETAWRSLRFLVDRIDFRASIQMEVIPAPKEDLARVLNSLLDEAETAEVPLAAVITDFEFGNSVPAMELLKDAATIAEQLQAPIFVNVGSGFFGKMNSSEVSGIPLLHSFLESPEFVKWESFRQSESSRWVGVGFNRFLLRLGYEESSGMVPFRFREPGPGLWGNASWAIGMLVARSYAESSWCGHFTGVRGGGLIEDLLVRGYQLPSGGETQIPLETIFLKDREDDFFDAGFMVLQCAENQDKAVLLRAPSAHRAEIFSDAAETEASRWRVTLTYQLVAARFVHLLGPMIQRFRLHGNASEIEQGIRTLLTSSGGSSDMAGVDVRLLENEARPAFCDLRVSIRPGPAVWSLPTKIELAMPLRMG
jgi:type VI secretion system protein ImpC